MKIIGMKQKRKKRFGHANTALTYDTSKIVTPLFPEKQAGYSHKKTLGFRFLDGLHNGANLFRITMACLATLLAFSCFVVYGSERIGVYGEELALTSVGFVMPGGVIQIWQENSNKNQPQQEGNSESEDTSGESSKNTESLSSESENQANSQKSNESTSSEESNVSSEEVPLQISSGTSGVPIQELQIENSGQEYQGVFVKNGTQNHEIDIKSELEKEPAVKIKTDGTPQVLIYHTHTTESYLLWEQDVFPDGTPTRSQDNGRNVVLVGEAIAAQLRAAGIGVIHDTTCHDYPAYNGAYSRSAATIEKNLKQYPSIQVTIDIHRDAMGNNERRLKPTVTINGKKAAQFMIMSGCDDDGTLNFPDWEQNLRLALRLQEKAAEEFPGLARPLNFCNSLYNMNMTKGSLLVEIGTEVNTLEEATYTGQLFGKVLADTLLTLR